MLAERISLEAICRIMEIEAHQVYTYMAKLYDEVPQNLACSVKDTTDIKSVKIDSELDELWTGPPVRVGWKANKQWLWLALNRASCQVVALFIGDRSANGALGLWQALPERYR
jgi:insertion element IS1 protein InsB